MADTLFDCLIVGAGPAGTLAARRQHKPTTEAILVLEAGDRLGGKTHSGLHLMDAVQAESFDVLRGPTLKEALIRWERQWVAAAEVDWNDKTWLGKVPQWQRYLTGAKTVFLGMKSSDVEINVESQCPVSQLTEVSDAQSLWKLETAKQSYLTKKVIWAAGLTAFQNAVGKQEAQEYMVANPQFHAEAQDFRGGLGFEMIFETPPEFLPDVPLEHVLAVPIKHGGTRYLSLAAAFTNPEDGKFYLQSLTHVHQDLLADPKEVMSLQKSLRRFLITNLFGESFDQKIPEKWVVSHRVGGHTLGSPWLLGAGRPGSLEFVGEESIAAQAQDFHDTLGALSSVTTA